MYADDVLLDAMISIESAAPLEHSSNFGEQGGDDDDDGASRFEEKSVKREK